MPKKVRLVFIKYYLPTDFVSKLMQVAKETINAEAVRGTFAIAKNGLPRQHYVFITPDDDPKVEDLKAKVLELLTKYGFEHNVLNTVKLENLTQREAREHEASKGAGADQAVANGGNGGEDENGETGKAVAVTA